MTTSSFSVNFNACRIIRAKNLDKNQSYKESSVFNADIIFLIAAVAYLALDLIYLLAVQTPSG